MKNLILLVALLTSVDAFAQRARDARQGTRWNSSYTKKGFSSQSQQRYRSYGATSQIASQDNSAVAAAEQERLRLQAERAAQLAAQEQARLAAEEQQRLAAEAAAAALVAQQGTPGGSNGVTWVTYPSTTFLDGTVSTLPFTSYTDGQNCMDRGFVYVQLLNNNGVHSSISDGCYVRGDGNASVFNSSNCGRLEDRLIGGTVVTTFDENNQNINYCRPHFHGGGYHSVCFAEQDAGLEPSPDCVEEANHTVTVVPRRTLIARVDATGGAGCYESYEQMTAGIIFGGGNYHEVIYRDSNGHHEVGVGIVTGGGDVQCRVLRGIRGNNLQSIPSPLELSSHSRAETGACALSIVRESRKNAPLYATECKETYQGVEMSVSYDIP